ncbi:nucleolar complex protein 14 [Rhodosporidiobolus nylandii]
MGGSQLSQLKAKLRDSGLSRSSNPKDPRKRTRQRKDLSATSQQHRSAKLQAIHDSFNVFDTRDEAKKFAVVTRKGTEEGGVKGMPGRARAAGIEQRKKTLLPMLDARTHSSTFVDHRFGEASSHLTPEEKALERFTAERQQRLAKGAPGGKKARFNLEDEGDDSAGFELTHGGRKLGFGDEDELEDGGWGGLGVSEGANREPLLNRRKMGAEPEDEPERKKTHAEIMEEAERQRLKSADDTTRLELDSELKDLRSLLAGGGVSRPSSSKAPAAVAEESEDEDEDEEMLSGEEDEEEDSEGEGSDDGSEGSTYELNDEELEQVLAASSAKSGVDRDLLRKLIGSAADEPRSPSPAPSAGSDAAPAERPHAAAQDEEDDGEKDPYDLYVRQLALEPRAKATNRLKTPLELAAEAAETLKKQEERRLKRQRGERDDSPSSDEEGGRKKERKRAPQGDDLDDGYLEENYGSDAEGELGAGLEGRDAGADAVRGNEAFGGGLEGEGEGEADEEEGSEEEEVSGEEDEEESDDDELDVGDLDAESSEEEDAAADLAAPAESLIAGSGAAPKRDENGELPYTFPCPSSHGEFAKLLASSGVKEEDTVTVVKRIRTLYHPGLAEGNKEKLQVFTNVLLDHIIYLCASSSPSAYRTVNSLLPQLLTLTHAYPLTSAPHYTSKLSLMHKNLLRGLSRGPLEPSSKTWPSLPELTLLRLVGASWSTSDLSHPVGAPALLLIAEYLSQCRVRSLSDLASGLFLATLAAQYEAVSKRAVPEALNFVTLALALLLPSSVASQKAIPGEFPCPDLGAEHAKPLKLRASSADALAPSGTASLVDALKAKKPLKGKEAEQLKVELVSCALKLVEEFRAMQNDSEAFAEMFSPLEKVLRGVKEGKVPKAVKDEIDSTLTSLQRSLKLTLSTRRPLTLQSHRAIPLATYLPKFDEGFNPNRKFDPDSERAEQSKLRQLIKKEKKGAVRELRNDNRFLAQEEKKRKQVDDVQYEKKITKIMRGLQDERAEEKAFERTRDKGKRKDKARSGRR